MIKFNYKLSYLPLPTPFCEKKQYAREQNAFGNAHRSVQQWNKWDKLVLKAAAGAGRL